MACAKAICSYILDTYGTFPATVDSMHLMWFMQVHHLDLDFYDGFFKPAVYGLTHPDHITTWRREVPNGPQFVSGEAPPAPATL